MSRPESVSEPVIPLVKTSQWLRGFWPSALGIDWRERVRMVCGVLLGVLVVAILSRWTVGTLDLPVEWMVASLGASAVLVFCMPSSPFAQPWPVLAGSALSALVGALCALAVPDVAWAGALAVGLSVMVMIPLRCLHPPGAGTALLVVLSHGDGAHLAMFPVLFNAVVLVVVGVVYNTATGRPYPYVPKRSSATSKTVFTREDIDVALAQFNQVLDISRGDLESLLHRVGRAAFQRTLGELRCADIMTRPPLAVEAAVELKEAWALMRREGVKALPVVDGDYRVIGIVTRSDFMRLVNLDVHEGIGQRLRSLVMGRGAQPRKVRDIQTAEVQMASQEQHVMDLVPLFSEGGHHHIPVLDAEQRLVGMVTQSDLVRALARAVAVPQ
jgi:CBS domain-containing membrane protein